MQIEDYYAEEYAHAVELRNRLLKSGYNAPVVFKLNALLSKFDTLINEYGVLKQTIDKIATTQQEFGSNRNLLREKLSNMEQLKQDIKTLIAGIEEIEINQLTANSVSSNFVDSHKPVCINRSENAFPECRPIQNLNVPNNLYLIEDKELENYNVLMSQFLDIAKQTYNRMRETGNGEQYASAIAEIGYIIKSSEKVLNTIEDLVAKKEYYNRTFENIAESDIQYADYEAYPDIYHEAKSIISDIYTMNCDKFDKIIAEF